ncbi:accessory Sec system translocase SecA2 [Actinosynnema mirum]|uniref:Protein translocase subunit SecA n=1 Tax=Actinosynnema mirum (strain ATCC 29888 / DSM 43827 / JCM 3225 / NBRC 14064 / NCIMB 13271 / NRRL B-12336 / IMRU 3971 / 101) TaxID=446462 RepID=C6WBH6_ACTMD|nr:accessory Sec system translocase SecA2 [Actinosynnema mirum]ACU35544.1 SecA DEAD domain protein [Actinosynnema mirum DSM 43827]
MTTLLGRFKQRLRRFAQKPGSADLSPYRALLDEVNARAEAIGKLSDTELTEAATALREKAPFKRADLVEVVALGREAADRALGLRPFDVQVLGALGLLDKHVVEMATGEGKTLSGAIAAAGFALQGKQAHVVSVNDYLAQRDAEWMGPLYALLGVSAGWLSQSSKPEERRAAYQAEVTYASVSEIGFDVLRDRLATSVADRIVPEPSVALVDEADSVFVDEARVPLVLAGSTAGPAADPALAELVKRLRRDLHFEVDDEERNVYLTGAGSEAVERALGGIDLYSDEHVSTTLSKVNVALHAQVLLHRDVDYIVRDGKVHLINDTKGRIAKLQRWPDGLQAAVEAKEAVATTDSGEVLDSITVQALLNRYPLVCGMTGTAVAVAEQLRTFYALEVLVIPSNVDCVREDEESRVYATLEQKEAAIVAAIAEAHGNGRPILVGTLDVAESERLSRKLAEAGLECVVLNAKNDAEEASIIADAGSFERITVSTQMAGRGTDIRLGGHESTDRERIAELGGLYVIGTGRHSSSRLDDQLRGRAGRQGDPGGSVFFSSLQDELFTQYVPDFADASEVEEDGRVVDRGTLATVEHAQRVAEGVHLEIHRNTWRYSKLIEHQRLLLLKRREELLTGGDAWEELARRKPERAEELAELDEEVRFEAARQIALHHLDQRWTDHLVFLTDLREGIHLRALARQNPLDEFHREAITAFNKVENDAWEESEDTFVKVTIDAEGAHLEAAGVQRPNTTWTYLVHDNPFSSGLEETFKGLVNMVRRK